MRMDVILQLQVWPSEPLNSQIVDIEPFKTHRIMSNCWTQRMSTSFVVVEELSKKYIVTQGPMQNTINHFWQMVWEQQSVGIVMLCKCEERGTHKCARYWPTMETRPITGCYVVECTTSDWNSYTPSPLSNCMHDMETGETRTILHFHFFSWSDFKESTGISPVLVGHTWIWCNATRYRPSGSSVLVVQVSSVLLMSACCGWKMQGVCTHWTLSNFSFTCGSRDSD